MLLNGLGTQYDNLRGKINNCNGVTEEMYEIMNNTAEGNIEKLKSKLEGLGIQLGEKLLPRVNDLIDKISGLIDWFANLDEGTQQTIINMGLFTLTAGASLKAIGGLTQGIGSIVGVVGKGIEGFSKLIRVTEGVIAVVNATADLNNSTMTKSKEEMSALEVAIGKVTGATMYSREELENMGAVYRNWNENISEETQRSLEDMSCKFRELQHNMDLVNLDGVVSEQEVNFKI